MRRALQVAVWVVAMTALRAQAAEAQVIGTFRWQLQPYCNVVTLTVIQTGSTYALQGTDDQCGGLAAGVTGVAFVEPLLFQITVAFDTAHNLDLNRVFPIHTIASISMSSLGGSWRDSAGLTGSFAFTPGAAVPGGSARPRTKQVSLGSSGTNVTIAANACIVRETVGGIATTVVAGDLIVLTQFGALPAGIYIAPLVAGANGRFGIMYCNGTSSPVTSLFVSVGVAREPQ
jgi:hypothetical protein